MILIPKEFEDKIEGAFYAYFYHIPTEVTISGVIYCINHTTGTRPLAWVRKVLLITSDTENSANWLRIAEQIFLCNDELLRRFILRRYGLREKVEDTCYELGFEKSAYYRYKTGLIYSFALKAAAMGLG